MCHGPRSARVIACKTRQRVGQRLGQVASQSTPGGRIAKTPALVDFDLDADVLNSVPSTAQGRYESVRFSQIGIISANDEVRPQLGHGAPSDPAERGFRSPSRIVEQCDVHSPDYAIQNGRASVNRKVNDAAPATDGRLNVGLDFLSIRNVVAAKDGFLLVGRQRAGDLGKER